jgi:eukaryotic-like serine/threonine-protein kinase
MNSTDSLLGQTEPDPPNRRHSPNLPVPPRPQTPQCEVVVEQFVHQLRQGEAPEVSDYVQRFPELAEELLEILPTLVTLEDVARDPEMIRETSLVSATCPSQLGRYRILREVGRGGMGIVYEAEHLTMRRRVALKVLPPHVAADRARLERFHREARAAGRLHHTNIVPVFEVGSSGEVHYYAMQFIRGQSLDAVFQELRKGTARAANRNEEQIRRIARVGLQVADALAYAHRQGVLHRDIKPANLLLEDSGVVWITDFGLAKDQGEELTQSGDVIGTLRYLAPECLERAADARSDIYGLGLTLYELLTGEYAFEASGRASLLRQVVREHPMAPRQRNPSIPRDLETIVLKAIDKHPEHRYATADEMVEDLQRFLDDRPIRSRPIAAYERLWRWCRRNPQQASLAVLVLVMLGALVCGSLLFAVQSNYQARRLHAESERARDSERLAQQRLYAYSRGRAQALRWTGRPGQRIQGLEAIREAAIAFPSLELDALSAQQELYDLRSEAVANMVLPDLEVVREWNVEPGWTNTVAWDAEYQTYAQSHQLGDIHIREAHSDRLIQRLPGWGDRAWIIALSADAGRLVAKYHPIDGPAHVRLWNTSDGAVLVDRQESLGSAAFAFHPGGDELALGTLGGIELIQASNGRRLRVLPETVDPTFLVYNQQGTYLACSNMSGHFVHVWDLTRGECLELGTPAGACGLDFAPNGQELVVGLADGTIEIFSLDDVSGEAGGKGMAESQGASARRRAEGVGRILKGHRGQVVGVALDSTGRWLASSSWDGTVQFWDLRSREAVLQVDGMTMARFSFHADQPQLAFRSLSDRRFGIWHFHTDGPLAVLTPPEIDTGYMTATWHPVQGRVVVAGHDRGIDIWDRVSEQRLRRIALGRTQSVWITPDGAAMFTSGQAGVHRWQLDPSSGLPSADPMRLLPEPSERFSIARDGRLLAIDHGVSRGSLLMIGDPQSATGQDLVDRRLWFVHGGLDHAVLSPDANWLATSTWQGRGIRIHETNRLELVHELEPETGSASVAFRPDGERLVVCSADARRLYETATWKVVWQRERVSDDQWPGPVAFSPDGKYLAVSQNRHQINILDAETGDPLLLLESPRAAIQGGFQFRADGRELIASARRDLQIWDLWGIEQKLKDFELAVPSSSTPSYR